MIVLRSIIVAVIIFIPLASIQHFVPPVSYCALADICNHSWIPVCAWDIKSDDYKIFTDECDVYEFNCDRDANYHLVNYADCFNPSLSTTTPCPVLDKLMTKILGYYIFRPNGAKTVYASTTVRTTEALRRNQRRYTPEKTRKIRKETTTCSPCERNKKLLAELEAKAWSIEPVVQSTTKEKRKSGPVKRSRTEATIVLKKETVWKNGKIMHKVVKGFKPNPKTTKRTHDDSDFLENLA